jgi:di/tricarboxylate transporter
MTPLASLALILLAMILSVVFGRKRANMGLIALGLAYILGCFVFGLKANALYAMFPAKIILQFIFISYFYGVLIENGTIQWVAEKVSYAARKAGFLIPIIIFVLTLVLSLAGVAPVSVAAAVAPLFLAIADKMKINKLLVLLAIHTGQCAGCGSPVSGVTLVTKGIVGDSLGAGNTDLLWNQFMVNFILVFAIIFVIAYVVLRGWRVGKLAGDVELGDPGKPNQQQIICLIMALVAIIFLIVPSLLGTFTGNAAMQYISGKADPGFVYLILGLLCIFLRYGEEKVLLSKRVPWPLVLVIGGMAILIGLLGATGATDYLAGLLSNSVPTVAIAPALSTIGGFLSMFSDSLGAVIPLLASMVPSIVANNAQLSATLLISAACIGTMMTGFAPFSTGGSLLLSFTKEEERNRFFVLQLVSTILMMVATAAVFAVGIVLH